MFGKWRYQNKINEEVALAAQMAFGAFSSFQDVLRFKVHGNALGVAVEALYERKSPPVVAAQAAVMAQIDLCTDPNDEDSIRKWRKVLRALEAREINQAGILSGK